MSEYSFQRMAAATWDFALTKPVTLWSGSTTSRLQQRRIVSHMPSRGQTLRGGGR